MASLVATRRRRLGDEQLHLAVVVVAVIDAIVPAAAIAVIGPRYLGGQFGRCGCLRCEISSRSLRGASGRDVRDLD